MTPRKSDECALLQIPRCFVMAYPSQASAGGETTIGGHSVATLDPAVPADAGWTSLPVSFEDAYGGLEAIAGVFLEPDGSFTLTAFPEAKLEGQLNDEGQALAHVELWGICRASEFGAVRRVDKVRREP